MQWYVCVCVCVCACVCVRVYTSRRVLLHIPGAHLQGNITSYFFKLSEVSNEGKLHASHQVSIRVAAQNAFLFSNFSDASYVNLGTVKVVSTGAVIMYHVDG